MKPLTFLLTKLRSRFSAKPHSENIPVDLSFSRLQTYQRCPWMYHLVYDLGWRSGPNAGMALGMSLHKALAAYHSPENVQKTLERLWEIYDEVWVNEGFKDTQETLDTYDRGRKMLEKFFNTDQKRTGAVIGAEKEFNVALNGAIHFHGTIDRLDKHADGSYEIIEYKTQNQHWTENRIDTDLQMTLYELGMRKTLGEGIPIKLSYHFLSSDETVTTVRTSHQLNDAFELMNSVASRIRKKDFNPNYEHCPKCEFGNRCQYSKKTQVRN